MHGTHLDDPLQKWFDFKVPKTSVDPDYIARALTELEISSAKPTTKIVWLGRKTATEYFTQSKKGNSREMVSLSFTTKKETQQVKVNKQQGDWLAGILPKLSVANLKTYTLQEVKESYEAAGLEDFELFWDNKPVSNLYKFGLLKL
jgi:hypothetical protein